MRNNHWLFLAFLAIAPMVLTGCPGSKDAASTDNGANAVPATVNANASQPSDVASGTGSALPLPTVVLAPPAGPQAPAPAPLPQPVVTPAPSPTPVVVTPPVSPTPSPVVVTPPVLPALNFTVPAGAFGWTDAAAAALSFDLGAAGGAAIPSGALRECRTISGGGTAPSNQAFVSCDGVTGSTAKAVPVRDTVKPEGSYAIDARLRLGTDTGPTSRASFYVHESLNGVARCPEALPDDAFFDAAAALPQIAAPLTATFGTSTVLANPFVRIAWALYEPATAGIAHPSPGQLIGKASQLRSLRHRFARAERSGQDMLLVRRNFVSRFGGTCGSDVTVGVRDGRSRLSCAALVFTAQGRGVCLSTETVGGTLRVATPNHLAVIHYGASKLGGAVSMFSWKLRIGETSPDPQALVLPD